MCQSLGCAAQGCSTSNTPDAFAQCCRRSRATATLSEGVWRTGTGWGCQREYFVTQVTPCERRDHGPGAALELLGLLQHRPLRAGVRVLSISRHTFHTTTFQGTAAVLRVPSNMHHHWYIQGPLNIIHTCRRVVRILNDQVPSSGVTRLLDLAFNRSAGHGNVVLHHI